MSGCSWSPKISTLAYLGELFREILKLMLTLLCLMYSSLLRCISLNYIQVVATD